MENLSILENINLPGINFIEFIFGLIEVIIFSIIIKRIYINYSSSVSNKTIIAKIFPLFATSVFVMMITIKSNIVMSLGLVGALSIIRFRTAIKEPEDLVYFLILTSIGITAAAELFLFPLIFLVFIYLYSFLTMKKINNSNNTLGSQIILSKTNLKNNKLEELIQLINDQNISVSILNIDKHDELYTIILQLSHLNMNSYHMIEEFLKDQLIKYDRLQVLNSID